MSIIEDGYNTTIEDPNAISPFRKFLGLALIVVSAIISGSVLLVSADILAAFFSVWQVIQNGTIQPSGAINVENTIPLDAYLALGIVVISITVSAIVAVLRIVLKKF